MRIIGLLRNHVLVTNFTLFTSLIFNLIPFRNLMVLFCSFQWVINDQLIHSNSKHPKSCWETAEYEALNIFDLNLETLLWQFVETLRLLTLYPLLPYVLNNLMRIIILKSGILLSQPIKTVKVQLFFLVIIVNERVLITVWHGDWVVIFFAQNWMLRHVIHWIKMLGVWVNQTW